MLHKLASMITNNLNFMKTTLVIGAFIAVLNLSAQNENADALKISTKPDEVMVYLNGAQVFSKGNANLKPGRQTIVFDKLSNHIDANSVQVKADADVTILSVNYQLNYLKPQDFREYQVLDDSLKIYSDLNARLAITRRSYEEELSMLNSNKSIGGSNVGVSVSELTKMADFIRLRVQETSTKKYEIEVRERKNNERIQAINSQLSNMRNNDMKPTGEIVVQLNATNAGSANFELAYYVTNCGWVPSYDIRVKDVNSPSVIAAKANVYQNSGQDWKNVKLSLSTGNPSRGNTKPNLIPWWLSLTENLPRKDYYKKSLADDKSKGRYTEDAPAPAAMDRSLSEVQISSMPGVRSNTAASYTTVASNTTTNATFEIKIPYTIKSDGGDNFVEIQKYDIAANYKYFAIPKSDKDAFLLAELIGWDKSELLPGDANVYFENNYVGKTYFDSRIIDDTLSVALGRDNNVIINRKQVKELNEKTAVNGSQKKVTRTFEIEVKNTRKSAIELDLEDQIPLSNNELLIVELLDSGKAEYNKETGKLEWKIKLQPGEATKLRFSYSVRYPKKYILNGL